MKNRILFFVLLIPIKLLSQTDNDFEFSFKNSKNYITEYESYTVIKTSLEGDQSIIENLNRAISYPLETTILHNVTTSLIPGTNSIEGVVPIKFNIIKAQGKITLNQNSSTNKSPLSGKSFEGVFLVNNKIVFKPESTKNLNPSEINELLSFLDLSSNSIKFPESLLTNEFQFKQIKSLTIPIEGLKPIKCSVEYVYTLAYIKNNIIHFKIDQVVKKDTLENDQSIILTGNGNGEMDYDVNNRSYLNQTLNSFVSIRFKSELLDVISTYTNSIKKNITIK